MLGAVFVEGYVDLASAEDDTVNLVGREDGVVFVRGVGENPLEM